MSLRPKPTARILLLSLMLPLFAAAASPEELAKKPDDWFRSAEGTKAAANVLSWQAPEGSWPKNNDTSKQPYTGNYNACTACCVSHLAASSSVVMRSQRQSLRITEGPP